MSAAGGRQLDVRRLVECLDRHHVEYLIVGGVGAQLHGARRPTLDFDSLPATTSENLGRLALALKELNAYLRVGGLTDEEARALPTQIDATSLARMDISTWRTDAGDLDVLTAMRTVDGARLTYDELLTRAEDVQLGTTTVRVAALGDIIASKEWADRPKDRDALDELRRLRDDEAPNH